MSKGTFRIIMACLVLILFLIKVLPDATRDSNCETFKIFSSLSLDGVITNKYIDSVRHSYKTLTFKNFGSKTNSNLDFFDFDTTDFYDDISVGDSIFKRKHSDSVFKYTNGIKIFFYKLDFGCDLKSVGK